jgi:hypothetical protein
MPPFYLQLFHFWYELHSRPPEDAKKMLDEYIWYNKRILIDNKPIYYAHWYEQGIKKVYDIIKLDGTFYSLNELSIRHRVDIDLMKYNSVISAIPKEWKSVIKESSLNAYSQGIEDETFIELGNMYKEFFSISCK